MARMLPTEAKVSKIPKRTRTEELEKDWEELKDIFGLDDETSKLNVDLRRTRKLKVNTIEEHLASLTLDDEPHDDNDDGFKKDYKMMLRPDSPSDDYDDSHDTSPKALFTTPFQDQQANWIDEVFLSSSFAIHDSARCFTSCFSQQTFHQHQIFDYYVLYTTKQSFLLEKKPNSQQPKPKSETSSVSNSPMNMKVMMNLPEDFDAGDRLIPYLNKKAITREFVSENSAKPDQILSFITFVEEDFLIALRFNPIPDDSECYELASVTLCTSSDGLKEVQQNISHRLNEIRKSEGKYTLGKFISKLLVQLSAKVVGSTSSITKKDGRERRKRSTGIILEE